MALIDLTSPEMVDISGAWLDTSSTAGKAIARSKGLVPLLLFVREAHEGLTTSQVVGENPHAGRIKELAQQNVELDRDHDRLVRGSISLLDSLALLAKTPKRRAAYESLSVALFPAGASTTQLSYSAEAGTAAMVDERLTEAHRKTLESVTTPEGSLSDVVGRWKKVARALGESDKERTRLLETKAEGTTKADGIQARNAWIRAVDVFRRATPWRSSPRRNRPTSSRASSKPKSAGRTAEAEAGSRTATRAEPMARPRVAAGTED
jgi:hypothetical protein